MALDLELAQRAATVMLNLALAVAVGAGVSAFWLAPARSAWAVLGRSRVRLFSLAALAGAMLTSAAVLWMKAAEMGEVPVMQAGAAAWTMLAATHLGTAWAIGIGALACSMGAMALNSRGDSSRRLLAFNLLGLAAFLYTRSMVSHASADGDFTAPMIADWLHLVLICLWTGEVFVAGFVTLATPPADTIADCDDGARYIEALSTSATIALTGIVATGVFNAWHNLGSPGALAGNPYGATLLAKLALVAFAVLLGGFNRFFVMPALLVALRERDSSGVRRFTAVLRIEAVVLTGVLILAAILSSTAPPTAG